MACIVVWVPRKSWNLRDDGQEAPVIETSKWWGSPGWEGAKSFHECRNSTAFRIVPEFPKSSTSWEVCTSIWVPQLAYDRSPIWMNRDCLWYLLLNAEGSRTRYLFTFLNSRHWCLWCSKLLFLKVWSLKPLQVVCGLPKCSKFCLKSIFLLEIWILHKKRYRNRHLKIITVKMVTC